MTTPFLHRALIVGALAFAPTATLANDYALNAPASAGTGQRSLSTRPSAQFRSAIAALRRGRTTQARQTRDAMTDGFQRDVVTWAIAAYGTSVPAAELATTLTTHADWPRQTTIRAKLEAAILEADPPAQALAVAFSAAEPQTVDARIALASAHLELGDPGSAAALIRPVWATETLDRSAQARLLKRFARQLRRSDHRARVFMLLARERVNAAIAIAGEAGATRMVAAAAAVIRKQRDAARRLDAVPASQRGDALYLTYLARYRRSAGRPLDAATALLATSKPATESASDLLWREHRIVAGELLAAGQTRTAYRLASHDITRTAKAGADAAFFAGWVALRHRDAPSVALRHFERLATIATLPRTKSRAAYWQGRALEKLGRSATSAFTRAAAFDTTFYGQLAAQRLGQTRLAISKPRPSDAAIEREPFFAALRLLEGAGADGYAGSLRYALSERVTDPAAIAALALRYERKGDHRAALGVGRVAERRGMAVDSVSHPLGAIGAGHGLSEGWLAMAYAVARQESSFQIDARSGADALGLMQVLPGTARQTARRIGLRYDRRRLTRDPAYNVAIGTAFLKRQLSNFGNSWPLTLAAYNAGPRRASDWIERLGDPRRMSPDDAIDWVEGIPFSETRNYVQKVLANRSVYRTRITGSPLDLAQVLNAP